MEGGRRSRGGGTQPSSEGRGSRALARGCGGCGGCRGGSTGECPDVPARASREPAGPRRRGLLPSPPHPHPHPEASPPPAATSPGSRGPARVEDTWRVSVSARGCSPRDPLPLRPQPSASASSPCLLRPLPHPRHHPLRAGASSAASAQCAWGGDGATRTFLPLLSPGCPLPRPPHLWDVSLPAECLVGPLGWSKCSSRVP